MTIRRNYIKTRFVKKFSLEQDGTIRMFRRYLREWSFAHSVVPEYFGYFSNGRAFRDFISVVLNTMNVPRVGALYKLYAMEKKYNFKIKRFQIKQWSSYKTGIIRRKNKFHTTLMQTLLLSSRIIVIAEFHSIYLYIKLSCVWFNTKSFSYNSRIETGVKT